MWISLLIGAQPRKGKTFFARLIALYAALDPYVRLTIVDGKMSPDWDKFRLVAHRMVFGNVPNPATMTPSTHLLEALREIGQHIPRRQRPVARCRSPSARRASSPANSARKYPTLRPWMLVMEEFQAITNWTTRTSTRRSPALLSTIMSIGPSAGVISCRLQSETLRVGAGDVGRLFNRFRDNLAVRFALRCGNRVVSEAVLGGDAYAEGFDASALPNGEGTGGSGFCTGPAMTPRSCAATWPTTWTRRRS